MTHTPDPTPRAANDPASSERPDWMGVFARADAARLGEALETTCSAIGGRPSAAFLRPPEIGAIMVQGRAGGTGAPFNQGEMTVTRAVLRLEDGTVGHAWVPGRDRDHAANAALADALMQRTDSAEAARRHMLAPLQAAERAARQHRAERAAATRVDFFTMVRGEDE
ncbi:MAG: phosphonate C-P lyase system protein PhnG [Pseudomonadota bacterium]